jgi:immunomodulating metalloprotease
MCLMKHPYFSKFICQSAAAVFLVLLASCGGGGGGTSDSGVATSTPSNTQAPGAATPGPTTVTPGSGTTTTPTPTDPDAAALAAAMASGNASAVSLPIVMAAAKNQLSSQMLAYANTRQSLFGLNTDGTANANSLSGIDWNPTRDSVHFTVLDQAHNQAFLPGNWRYSDSTAGSSKTLAVTGKAANSGARYAAFGGNPMAVQGNANMDLLVKNTVAWLTGQSSGSSLK